MKVYVNEISSPKDIAFSLEKLGVLVGQKNRGLELSSKFSKEILRLKNQESIAIPLQFFQLGNKDLFTFNEQHFWVVL